MNNLLKGLESLKITSNISEEDLWTGCIDLIQKSYVSEIAVGASRPCEEKDFKEYKQIIDQNLQNIKFMLQHIIHCRNEKAEKLKLDTLIIKTFTINLLLLIGEQHEKNVWNTVESAFISKELQDELLGLYKYESVSQLLLEQDNFITVLLALRPKLLKDTWKIYPASVKPVLYNHIGDVLPTALIIVDDYVPENVVLGLECLYQIIQHSHLKKGLIDTGYANVILHALENLSRQREAKYVILIYKCLANLLATVEHWNTMLNVFEWTKRDDILAVLLDNMEFEQNVELRHVYMLSLPQLLTNIGCAKWCERLTRILSEYCEHHTDLRTLKATLETAKTFLLMFHLRVAAHCVPLYTAFLKLHFDLTKTPVFDKEIIQNLEDCICLLYKVSPSVGYAVMNDDRMRSVITNSLEVVYLGIPRLPIVGSYWHLLWYNYEFPFKAITYYTNKLKSKVLTCYFGGFMTVVASDYNSIKEVLINSDFDGRVSTIDVILARAFGQSLGIFFTEGSHWQEQRRFILRHMRDFGFGRRHEKVEADTMEEIAILIDMLKEGPINDTEKEHLEKRKHLNNDDDDDNGLVDRYLKVLKGNIKKKSFSEKQLIMSLVDFMFPALSILPSAVVHAIKLVMHHPKVMKNVQEEIDRVIGTERLVTWEDRKSEVSFSEDEFCFDTIQDEIQRIHKEISGIENERSDENHDIVVGVRTRKIRVIDSESESDSDAPQTSDKSKWTACDESWEIPPRIKFTPGTSLPYIEATIRESLRYITLTPFSVFHKTTKKTTLSGFDLAKNTIVITNLAGLNTDVDLWGDPDNFRPERFLNENGQLCKDFTFPFGFEGEPNSFEDVISGLIITPKETWIRVEPRYT
ncbi:hypothetical protein WN51_11828 [Melipona quadrifasciata]|uniref:Uncharacterized protein n=1 Tax=Melipona quadrifasciata TaxID=166423 RepID=A0A0M9A531_9HYME|nr:hypothetical protein WN51_11828 [Melipona quadrifasciata]